jgi:hypothetical protein
MQIKLVIAFFLHLLVVLFSQTVLQLSFAQDTINTADKDNLTFDEYLKSLLPPQSSFEKIINENSNSTLYENSYVGIKFSFTPTKNNPKPSGFKDGCLEDRFGCTIDVGRVTIDAKSSDEPHFSRNCNCDTLTDYFNYEYKTLEEIQHLDGNFSFFNDNETTIGNHYPARQYEYVNTPGPLDKPPYAIDPPWKHLVILTKVDNTFYKIWSFSSLTENWYARNLPEIKRVIDSIEFLTPQKSPDETVSSMTTETSNPSGLDQLSRTNSVEILSHNSYTDSLGFLHVVGEVKNNSPSLVEFVKIIGTFYDANDEVVGTHFTYTNPSDLVRGSKAPFDLILTSASIPISDIDHYNLAASYQ